MRFSFLLLVLLTLVGCNEARQLQKQAAADAIAGADAIATTPSERVVAVGIKTNISTAVGAKESELPPPAKMPEEIIADPSGYAQDADKTAKAYAKASSTWAWVGGGLLAILGVLRFVPGAHQPIVSIVQSLLENRVDKAAREKEEGLAQAARVMMGAIEAAGGCKIKAAVARKLPAKAKDAVDAYLAEMAKRTS